MRVVFCENIKKSSSFKTTNLFKIIIIIKKLYNLLDIKKLTF